MRIRDLATLGHGTRKAALKSRRVAANQGREVQMRALDEIGVIVAGLAAIGWIYWYFFRAQRSGGATSVVGVGDGRQSATILVRGGYEPATVRVRVGTPVRLLFDRRENNPCSEEIVIPDFGIRRYLPANERTAVEFTPERPGTYEFTCGMSMLRGRIVAE